MMAKPATCKKLIRHACVDPENSNGGEGGGVVPVSAYIRVSNSLSSYLIVRYIAGTGQFHKPWGGGGGGGCTSLRLYQSFKQFEFIFNSKIYCRDWSIS